jgi:RHS repeat-associated protein
MNRRHGSILFLFALAMMLLTPSQSFGFIPSTGANSTTTFGYSGDGERLWKQTSTTNGLQVWIGNIYEEKNEKTLYHIYAGSLLVCTLDAAGTVVDYYQSDHLHSSSILTSGTGAMSQHYEYTAYGQDRYINSATAFPITRRFTSQAKDDETGLMYYGARYYDPELGRFIQADTIIARIFDPQCLNRYSYCANNPLKYTDPTGHDNLGTGGENASEHSKPTIA